MLDPDRRSLLTTFLTPPPGMVFDSGITTTYTLDPISLLTVPLHLAWLASGEDKSLFVDAIRLHEALRRISDHLTVFVQRGQIQTPSKAHALYGLLESSIVEVRAPRGGAFHPKLWVLRFTRPGEERDVLIRVGVLSRNLTQDRCWDLTLQLDGNLTGRNVGANKELAELVGLLPSLAIEPVTPSRAAQVETLAVDVWRTAFDLPSPWEDLTFHTLGTGRRPWRPPLSAELAVISPFIKGAALEALCDTTTRAMVLVSRPDQLAALDPAVRARFERCMVLDDAAETEDGEVAELPRSVGLHAKAYLARVGWHSHLFVGSANATDAALVAGKNVELLIELIGRHSRVGRIEQLLGDKGLGSMLVDFDATTTAELISPEDQAAEQALDLAQQALAHATLKLNCMRAAPDEWELQTVTLAPVELCGVDVRLWPLSLRDERSVDGGSLALGAAVTLGVVATADVTGLVGFELRSAGLVRRFALNLPVQGLPPERDGAIMRRIVENREGFLRYLRMLLGDIAGSPQVVGSSGDGDSDWGAVGASVESLLEDLVRVYALDPARLNEVGRVVERLRSEDSAGIVPPEFLELWQVFVIALSNRR